MSDVSGPVVNVALSVPQAKALLLVIGDLTAGEVGWLEHEQIKSFLIARDKIIAATPKEA
jgi:hypothetical protein